MLLAHSRQDIRAIQPTVRKPTLRGNLLHARASINLNRSHITTHQVGQHPGYMHRPSIDLLALFVATLRTQPPHLPPLQPTEGGSDQYYPQSATAQLNAVFGREARSPRHLQPQHQQTSQGSLRGPVPRFQKVKNTQALQPKINSQPAFRRANPEGGFISVCL